jgi:hypothetical protein
MVVRRRVRAHDRLRIYEPLYLDGLQRRFRCMLSMSSSSQSLAYARALRRLIEDIASLESSEFSRVIEALESNDLDDVASAYVVSTVRLIHLWLIWEDHCRGSRRGVGRESRWNVCSEIEDFMRSGGAGDMGAATYFNMEVKRLLARMYTDLAPGILIPSWLLNYINRVEPEAANKLRDISLADQVKRLPVFSSATIVLDSAVKAMLDYYGEKRSDFAYAVAGYVYWEIVRPYSYIAEVLVTTTLKVDEARKTYGDVYLATLKALREDDTKPVEAPFARAVRELTEVLRRKLLEALKNTRLRIAR